MMLLGAIVCGFLLDLAIGDPHGWPHPIILIGNLISWLEKRVRAVSETRTNCCGADLSLYWLSAFCLFRFRT